MVKIVNEDTGVSLDTLSNTEGVYRFTALVPGKYRVEANLDGFDPATRRGLTLEVSQTLAIDITLNVAGQSETVNVSVEAPRLIESQSSNVALVRRLTMPFGRSTYCSVTPPGMTSVPLPVRPAAVFTREALASRPVPSEAVHGESASWLAIREQRIVQPVYRRRTPADCDEWLRPRASCPQAGNRRGR
jgi:hypothetical protein